MTQHPTFLQAENTSLAGNRKIDYIGFGATTTTVDEILKGTGDTDVIIDDPTSECLFDIFKTSEPKLKIKITQENMMDRYKRWNKRTLMSLSGRYLNHCHALFRPFKYKNRRDKESIEEKGNLIT